MNTQRTHCTSKNIPASQKSMPMVLQPQIYSGSFFTSFTDGVSDTILLHNEYLNCRQSESSKAEQTAFIIFFKYCYVGMKVFGSHNAFFIIWNMNRFRGIEAQWRQFSTSFARTQIHSQSKHCFLHSPIQRSNRHSLLHSISASHGSNLNYFTEKSTKNVHVLSLCIWIICLYTYFHNYIASWIFILSAYRVSNNSPIKQLIWAFLAEVDPTQAVKKSSHFQQPYTTGTILFGY